MKPCTKDNEFTCFGALVYTKQASPASGTYNFNCNTDEAFKYAGNDHDCICSLHRELDITTSKGNVQSRCSSDSDESKCIISWKGNIIDRLPSSSSCEKILVEGQCKFKCCTNGTEVLCEKKIKCTRSSDDNNGDAGICKQTKKSTTQKSSITRDDVSTTAPTTSTKSTTFIPIDKNHQTASQGNGDSVVIALGVVAGLAILALLITLVLVFVFRRRKRGRKAPSTDVYMNMNVSEVGSTTYESSVGNQKRHERLENAKDRQSGLYMDLDDTSIVKSDQTTQQQQSDTGATDSIYNSIDEYEPNVDGDYAQTDDLPQRSQDLVSPVDFPVTTSDYLVLDKPEEMSSTRPTEDLNPTGDYFVLDKDEDRVPSDITDNTTDSGIVNANKADNDFILEEQRNEC